MGNDFRLLATGLTLAWLGNGFQTVALAVAVVVAGGGAGDLGLVMAASVLAMLACALLGGVWADRLQPTRVMVLADLVRAAATAAIGVMFTTGGYHLPLLVALAAVSAGAGSFFKPAVAALKPLLVPVERRQSANATLSMLITICGVAGPALGGLLVAAVGAPAGFAVNTAGFLASALAAALIRARAPRAVRTGLWHELGEGWREIRGRDWLLSGVLAATVYHVANGVVLVLAPVIAVQSLGGATAVGFISSAEGVGGLVGATIAMRFRPRRLLRAGWLALVVMPLWPLSFVWPSTLVAVMAGAAIGYTGLLFFGVAWETALQDRIPQRSLGRVASWDQLTSFLAMPLGNAVAGPVSSRFGVDPVLVCCAGIMLVAALVPLLARGSRTLTRAVPPQPEPRSVPHPQRRPAATGVAPGGVPLEGSAPPGKGGAR